MLLLTTFSTTLSSLSPPFLSHHHTFTRRRFTQTSSSSSSSSSIKSMSFSSSNSLSTNDNNNNNNNNSAFLKLNHSTFLASLMPKTEIGVDSFLHSHPHYDGRASLIAIFDSGVDPAAAGLQVTSDGKPKILDILDCTGSGDIDTSKVVKADAEDCISGASGASLVINTSWKNPSGEWHVGYKLVYELFTKKLVSRLKRERKKKWDEKNQEEIAKAVKQLDGFDQLHVKVEEAKLKKARKDLQNRLDLLRKQSESYNDKGPVIDAVVWYDGEVWRAALDTQSLEDDPDSGKLANFVPLTNYRTERKYGVFSKLDACSFVANIYNDGNTLSIVTDCSPHGTHVAGIATAFHPEEPLLNGVAPGAQLISCKIGDSRLGSIETGTGLTRALIAAVEHKCDLINMSYGEPTSLPNYGRFVDLVNEAVNKHRLIFVSSAGNSGPALSTVGAPGGTSSSIIGVGAYVSPAMAAGAHSVVEPPSEGLEYTWSSRGPTTDGDLGVCISAPGAAVAPVPTWTLQRRMLMNGTSMASPSATGGIALLISAMKAEGIPVSPYSVRKALENTSVPIGDSPEDKLSTGHGLMQVDKCFEYIQKSQNITGVWYQINIKQSGKSNHSSRGIYLREASTLRQSTEWTVEVDPKFHEDANKLEELVVFEECIELHSTDETVVKTPEYLLLTHNGHTFNIIVDPTNLSDGGLHYYEVYGIDCKAPWRGPLFRIPITITKPVAVTNRPPQVSFSKMLFQPGHIERKYIEVPHGASWVEATMNTSSFDTARRFLVDAVQICPLQSPLKWRNVISLPSPAVKSFAFRVVSGQTLELVIAQFWSSGRGSHATTSVDIELVFHGVKVNQEEVVLDGSEAPVRIDAEALLASEKLAPVAILSKIRVPYRPIHAKISALSTDRDKLPSGKQILALTLTYKVKLEDEAEVKPQIPFLNDRIYDTKFESQFYVISDSNKRVYSSGDAYPNSTKLPKGEYNLQLYLRHDNVQILEKMKQLVLFIEQNLGDKDVIRLCFFSQPDGPLTGNGSFKSSTLVPGIKEAFYLSPPLKDKLPKNSSLGSVLVGAISYGELSFSEHKNPEKHPVSYRVSYIVPPNKIDEEKGKGSSLSSKKTVSERLEEEVRDAKIKVLGSLKQESDEERLEWKNLSATLKSEYPKYTQLFSKILEGLVARSPIKDKFQHDEQVIGAANEVIDSIDREELAKYFALRNDPDDEEAEKIKKKMESTRDHLAEALYQKGLALAEIESLKAVEKSSASPAATEGTKLDAVKTDEQPKDNDIHPDLFEENFNELKKWVDVKCTKYGILLVTNERRSQRLGTALKVLSDIIEDDNEPAKKKFYEVKLSLLEEIGWTHLVTYERQWMIVRFPPTLPLF
ncbi:PREDICTED: tripeptidyl-peptidase 2-like isoform X2 [Lupinus angustifolius]|uniref:tripeptidyl-peptidase 2-like isoform X2 n=1 Tax=Lupinus angustifolius TaxID=3871 RepID=UPI00092F920F|nr:PREDICTED: tripeptidyl-peptidase 2-like isoform X2 [Lupinus angustifolius]